MERLLKELIIKNMIETPFHGCIMFYNVFLEFVFESKINYSVKDLGPASGYMRVWFIIDDLRFVVLIPRYFDRTRPMILIRQEIYTFQGFTEDEIRNTGKLLKCLEKHDYRSMYLTSLSPMASSLKEHLDNYYFEWETNESLQDIK